MGGRGTGPGPCRRESVTGSNRMQHIREGVEEVGVERYQMGKKVMGHNQGHVELSVE